MGTQVGGLVTGTAVHERQWMIDLVGIGKAVPTTVAVALGTKCGIPRLGRIERLLHVIDGCLVLMHIAEHAHLDSQQVAEHALMHVHVARQIAQLVMQDHAVMIHVS